MKAPDPEAIRLKHCELKRPVGEIRKVPQSPFFLLFSLSLYLGSVFSDMVHRPAGHIMGYRGFRVFVNTRQIHTCPGKASEVQILAESWTEARHKGRIHPLAMHRGDLVTSHPPALLPDPSLLRDVKMHRPAPGIAYFILKADVKSYKVHGSAGFWLNTPLRRQRKAFCPCYILYILYT